jgi:sulfite exporter TauE/SafE
MDGWHASLSAAFALALLGGVHCAGMCGGFVGALQLHRPARIGAPAFAAAYHLGRVAAYTAAGSLIGAIGGALFTADVLPAQIVLLALASLCLALVGLSLLGSGAALRPLESLGRHAWQLLRPVAGAVIPPRSLPAAALAGFVWGWIPCGMVYAALPLALVTGSAARGALVMLAFGAGTLPNLLAIELGAAAALSRTAWRHARRWLRPVAGCAILLFAASDLAHAVHLAGRQSPALAMIESICHAAR